MGFLMAPEMPAKFIPVDEKPEKNTIVMTTLICPTEAETIS